MSVCLQFNCPTQNESARRAMENYVGFLEKAFEQYRNLWEDYIKLQEQHEQCSIHSSFQPTVDESCTRTKDKLTSEKQMNNGTIAQESKNISLLELESLDINCFDFNSEMETDSMRLSESLHKDANDESPPKSPVFSRIRPKISSISGKQLTKSSKIASVCNNSIPDIKIHDNIETVTSKCTPRIEVSTTHHVETTFLPDGKRLKQARLVFPIKCDEKTISLLDVDKLKSVNITQNIKQNPENNSVAEASITKGNAEVDKTMAEDVIEISPTQKNIKTEVTYPLKLKRKISVKSKTKSSPNKKYHKSNSIPEIIIDDANFTLHPPKYTPTQIENNKPLTSNTVNILKNKVNTYNLSSTQNYSEANIKIAKPAKVQKKNQPIISKAQGITQNASNFDENETFYLPAEQNVNENHMNDFNSNNTENKPSAKRILLDKFDILFKKKRDIPEQLNIQCKADRAKLNGWDCWECEEYYKNLSLSEEELQKRKNQCSRHRHRYGRPNTPEGFWDPEFPETMSCTYRQNKN